MKTIFIDGQEGTTGLKIHERLQTRTDLKLLQIDPSKRKDIEERRKLINQADVVILCLPDDASRQAVLLIENPRTKIIDASTAFRTHPGWTYGLPELNTTQRDYIKTALRVCVPGCHATGFILAIAPLIQSGIVPKDYPVTCHSVSGYSGGGKKMIAQYETEFNIKLSTPRHYALGLTHKHLAEMQHVTELTYPPLFTPIVSNYFHGMVVAVPLHTRLLPKPISPQDIQTILARHYANEPFVKVHPFDAENLPDNGFINAIEANMTNINEIFVFGNQDRILIISRLDNLGKGASGAAVQNLNIMCGFEETTGLV